MGRETGVFLPPQFQFLATPRHRARLIQNSGSRALVPSCQKSAPAAACLPTQARSSASQQWETGGAALHKQAEEEGPDSGALLSATSGGVSAMVKGGAPSSLGSSVGIGDRRGKGSMAGAARSSRGGRGPMCGEEECPGSTLFPAATVAQSICSRSGSCPCSSDCLSCLHPHPSF